MKRLPALLFLCNAILFGVAGGLLSLLPGFASAMGDPMARHVLAFSLAWMAVGVMFSAICHPTWNAPRTWIAVGLISAPGVALMGRYDGPAVLSLWAATVSVAWGIMAVLLQTRTREILWTLSPARRIGIVAAIALGVSAGGAVRALPASAASYSALFDRLALLWLVLVVVGILGLERAYPPHALQLISPKR